jgi:hypothetical protein
MNRDNFEENILKSVHKFVHDIMDEIEKEKLIVSRGTITEKLKEQKHGTN